MLKSENIFRSVSVNKLHVDLDLHVHVHVHLEHVHVHVRGMPIKTLLVGL